MDEPFMGSIPTNFPGMVTQVVVFCLVIDNCTYLIRKKSIIIEIKHLIFVLDRRHPYVKVKQNIKIGRSA